jgi:hypothetical protein
MLVIAVVSGPRGAGTAGLRFADDFARGASAPGRRIGFASLQCVPGGIGNTSRSSHHREVGHHVAGAEEVVHALEGLGDAVVAGAEDLGVFLGGLLAPLPRVLERLDLRLRLLAALLGEQDVVVGVGV